MNIANNDDRPRDSLPAAESLVKMESADARKLFDGLMALSSIEFVNGADTSKTLQGLGTLIDFASDFKRPDGLQRAVEIGNLLLGKDMPIDERVLVHYFLSNAWAEIRLQTRSGSQLSEWEQPEITKQIIHLRHALQLASAATISSLRHCQIHTNLGNLMSHCGRIVDAIVSWDAALAIEPGFPMALGNRAMGLTRYARLVHDPGHQVFHLREAYRCYREVLLPEHGSRIHPNALRVFRNWFEQLLKDVPSSVFEEHNSKYTFHDEMSPDELAYRKWCLAQRLFANDLNDLGQHPFAAADVLTLPGFVTSLDSGPDAIGFFNQLKQEYVSARYLYYAGITAKGTHFSDREVSLINTLDYPAYGLGTEQVRVAFRMAYSLLDKVAFFLNAYLGLGIRDRDVSFRSLWYDRQDPKKGFRHGVYLSDNLSLQGLFWLSKDLYEKEEGFTEALEPDARQVSDIRNHLEHKYCKLHLEGVPQRPAKGDIIGRGTYDSLAFSVNLHTFENSTLRLLRMVRTVLIHVTLTVKIEEAKRNRIRDSTQQQVKTLLDIYDDDWKR
jgi:hypothetical protein